VETEVVQLQESKPVDPKTDPGRLAGARTVSAALASNGCLLGAGSGLLLLGTTVFGFQAARWTGAERPDLGSFPWWPINLVAHLFVLGVWTLSWLLFWRHGLVGVMQRFRQCAVNSKGTGGSKAEVRSPKSEIGNWVCVARWLRGMVGVVRTALCSRPFALGIPFLAAAGAELVEKYLPGHIPDLVGFAYNLVGVGAALWLGRKLWG